MENKYRVLFLQTALDDIEEIVLYIARDNKNAALRLRDKIIETAKQLEMFPLIGMVCPDKKLTKLGYRTLVCEKYILFYKVIGNDCVIMRVLHGARDYPRLFGNFEKQ